MSAVPNLPESITRTHEDASLRHMENSKDAATHVEQAQVNGVKTDAPTWQLHDQPVENQRPIKVIVIGAGYSGIYLGIRLPEKLRNCELVIYEKNAGVGGTWCVNHIVEGVGCR